VHGLEEAVHELEAEAEDRPPAAGPVTNLATAAVIVALGVATLVGSWSLGVGTPEQPGPGAWPFLVSIVLVVLGVVLALLARTTTDTERFTRNSWAIPAGLATMVLFVALVGVIGFEIPAVLLAFVWLRFLGREGWRTSVITSVAVVAAFYLLFVAALAVPIPHLF
jgi:MFS family permease